MMQTSWNTYNTNKIRIFNKKGVVFCRKPSLFYVESSMVFYFGVKLLIILDTWRSVRVPPRERAWRELETDRVEIRLWEDLLLQQVVQNVQRAKLKRLAFVKYRMTRHFFFSEGQNNKFVSIFTFSRIDSELLKKWRLRGMKNTK
jgi:hypothetical protein